MSPLGDDHWLDDPLIALGIVAVAMLGEAVLSARHERRLRARGAQEPADDVYGWMQVTYPLGFVACAVEHAWRATPWSWVAVAGLVVFACGKAIKYLAMATLRERWSFRVLTLPGVAPVRHGIYGYLRHPNYVGVAGEIAGFALWMRSPLAGLVFGGVFALVLRARIRVEERALTAAWR